MSLSEPAGATAPRERRRWAFGLLALVLTAHVVLSVRQFPSLHAIVDPGTPVLVVDHAIHEYHGALGARFFHEAGTTWGYDPFFMAGYPETPVWDSSSNLSILFQTLAGGHYSPLAYKVGILVCLVLTVAMTPLGARAAGLTWAEAAVTALLAGFTFWGGFAADVWRSGLFAFDFVSGGLPLLIGVALWFDARPRPARWVTLTLAGAFLWFAHVTMPILALGAVAGYAAAAIPRRSWRWWAALGAAAVLVVGANAFWLVPLWRFRTIRTVSYIFMDTNTAWHVWDFLRRESVDARLTLAFLVGGTAGLVLWWREGARLRAAAFAGAAMALLALFALGSLWGPTRVLEPLRFRIPLGFALAVPTASAATRAVLGMGRRLGGGRRGAAAVAFGGAALVAILMTTMPVTTSILRLRVRLAWQHPLVVGFRPEMQVLASALRRHTTPAGRILFEDQLRLLEMTDAESVHWTPLLPFLLRPQARQFVGGLYEPAFIAHNTTASFGDFHLGVRYIDEWSADELNAYFERYNIGWVIAWSPLSRFYFDRLPAAQRIGSFRRYCTPYRQFTAELHTWDALHNAIGAKAAMQYLTEAESVYTLYRIDRKLSYALRGQAELSAVDFNRLELSNVVPEGGEVVLSMHWLDTWQTDPPLLLSPAPVSGDPVPFVRIALDRPVSRLTLFNGYRANRP